MRKNTQWLEFCGRRSDEMGAALVDFPRIAAGAPRVTAHSVAGRDGCLYLSDDTLSEFDISRTLRLPASRLQAAQSWLAGAGGLRFSARPDAVFDARIVKNVEYRQILPGGDPLFECTVSFSCQPRPALWPAAEESVFTAPGELSAPEGMLGRPRVTIEGSGAFSLTIGAETLFFTGVEGGVIVDSELGDALTLDGAQLANDKVSGPLFTLRGGSSAVSWIEGGDDETGSVARVAILPRWRFM